MPHPCGEPEEVDKSAEEREDEEEEKEREEEEEWRVFVAFVLMNNNCI